MGMAARSPVIMTVGLVASSWLFGQNRTVTAIPDVAVSWARIDRWLAAHAPDRRAALNGPADEDEIRRLERTLHRSLPADLVSSWRCVDGTARRVLLIPEYYDPYPIAQALDRWRMHQRVQWEICPSEFTGQVRGFLVDVAARPAGTPGPENDMPIWIGEWLPVAGNGAGGGLLVDLRDGPLHGCVLSYDRETNPRGPLWPSVAAMWHEVAETLNGGPRGPRGGAPAGR